MNTRPCCRPIHVLYTIVSYETHKTKTFRNLQLSEEFQVGIRQKRITQKSAYKLTVNKTLRPSNSRL